MTVIVKALIIAVRRKLKPPNPNHNQIPAMTSCAAVRYLIAYWGVLWAGNNLLDIATINIVPILSKVPLVDSGSGAIQSVEPLV